MNLLFEESGDFKAGTILSEQGGAYQVETVTGKRTKVKANAVLLQFEAPTPSQLLAEAEAVQSELDLDFLWECAPQEEFAFTELAADYFSGKATPGQLAGLLMKLHSAPVYFNRKGRGNYKTASAETLKAALAGIEKKRLLELKRAEYEAQLQQFALPEPYQLKPAFWTFTPDKNAIEYKALDGAAHATGLSIEKLMLRIGAFSSAHQLHLQRFLTEHFAHGTGFAPLPAPEFDIVSLPLAEVQAFSIDDSSTTEIDDALSVTWLADGQIRVGVHIAAPGLAIKPGDAIDQVARTRMSTVYMPGDKITMLPDELVNHYSLNEGKACAALSLYATVNLEDLSVVATESKIERVQIVSNLRHDKLDEVITEANLQADLGDYAFKKEITWLWHFAQALLVKRAEARAGYGLRPENNNRTDYNFLIDEIDGQEQVRIVKRKRGSPLDLIVAELMILANSSWGKLLADHHVPGIYRSQTGTPTQLRVRMTTHAAPHMGLGVAQYAWSTSPLRRYTDLVNQWQIIAVVNNGVAAALAAPFKPKSAELMSIVSAFDAAYGAYGDFQSNMERYWCLRWLAQHDKVGGQVEQRLLAAVLKDEVVRLADIPLVFKMPSLPSLPRGAQIWLNILAVDEVTTDVEARFVEPARGESEEVDALDDAELEEDALVNEDQITAPEAVSGEDQLVDNLAVPEASQVSPERPE